MASSTTTTTPPLSSNEEKDSFLPSVNVCDFVSSKLWGDEQSNNYSSWKQQMLCFIESHDLLHFVNHPEGTTSHGVAFQRTDMLLKDWILGALSDAVLNTVANSSCVTAKDVWLVLEKNFTLSGRPLNITTDQIRQKVKEYLPLYKAILQGNWEAAKEIFDKDPDASKARINISKQTALHVAVATGKAHHFVEKLVALMPDDESIALQDDDGNSALSIAAAVGNKKAATILINKMPKLLYISDNRGNFPVQQAALFAKRNMLRDLILHLENNYDLEINPYAGIDGLRLLIYAIDAEFFDVAIHLVKKYTHVAILKLPDGTSALKRLAAKWSLVEHWKDIKHACGSDRSPALLATTTKIEDTLLELAQYPHVVRSNMDEIGRILRATEQEAASNAILTARSVYKITGLAGKLWLIQQAIQLIKRLCTIMASMSHEKAADIYVDAIMVATELGSYVVIQQIVEAFPDVVYCSTPSSKQSILHIAAQNRSADIFNLIYQREGGNKYLPSDTIDSNGNNLLHAAAKLAPFHKLKEAYGASLQMTREIGWYKMMESIVPPNCRDQRNQSGQTPKMVFEEEHRKLKEEAEKWTKDTANSCMVVAALIAGVTFAGVITVPGGHDSSSGFAIFSNKVAFTIYITSNFISLFLSNICLFLLLRILLSRYADEDFLMRIPGQICLSLFALFSSVALMILSSSAAMIVTFNEEATTLRQIFVMLSFFYAVVIVMALSSIFGPPGHYKDMKYGTINIR